MNRIIIILDSYMYKRKEEQLKKTLEPLCVPALYYTDYENALHRFFQGVKGAGNILSHVSGWISAFYAAAKIFAGREKYDWKLFVNPIVGYFYCLLLSSFGRKNENVIISGFIFEQKRSSLYFSIRKKLVSYAFKSARKLIVYSTIEVRQYSRIFPQLEDKFVFVRYGRDFDIFEKNEFLTNDSYFASGGGSNRNFDTLVEAMEKLEAGNPEIKCKIATRPHDYDIDVKPGNLYIHHDIRVDRFGSFLEKSLFVVIPLRDNDISAGHMSLLESMHKGKVVIITDVPSVRDYVDEEQVFFYKSSDSDDLAAKIEYVFTNLDNDKVREKARAAKSAYDKTYGFGSFIERLVRECVQTVKEGEGPG